MYVQSNTCRKYWLSVAVQLSIRPRALRIFKKIAEKKINIVVILSTPGWSHGGRSSRHCSALGRYAIHVLKTISFISGVFFYTVCNAPWWFFFLSQFLFHLKYTLGPIAILLGSCYDPCKPTSDGWLNNDESLGSLIYMLLNSTFGSIRTKSNIYVVYWNC